MLILCNLEIEYQISLYSTNDELEAVFCLVTGHGGYILTSGILSTYVVFTSFSKRTPGSFLIILISGMSSIGLMTIANFMLQSDFGWVLLSFTLPWICALILYAFRK
jgi:hypothetical protein